MATTPDPKAAAPQFNDPVLQTAFITPEQKTDKKFAKTLLEAIYRQQIQDSDRFYGGRIRRLRELSEWAKGTNSVKEVLDVLQIDGNNAYTGVDPTPNRNGVQFVETLVSAMAENDEYPCVKAVDDGSIARKEYERQEALFRMNHAKDITDMEKQGGMMLEPPNPYVPEDELSARVYFELEHQVPVEVDFEKKVAQTMDDNEYPTLKRRFYRDAIVRNILCNRVEMLENGYVGIRKCDPINLVYNFFVSDSGKMELTYIGEIYSLKVKDLRRKFGKKNPTDANGLSEKQIYNIAKSANRQNNANRFNLEWNDSFIYAMDRKYDDYGVQVLDLEIKVQEADYYVTKPDAFGREGTRLKKGRPENASPDAKIETRDKETILRGVLAFHSGEVLYWGKPDLTIRPYQDISRALFTYTINIPNNDGEYVPSLFERALEDLKVLQLCKFKLKQLVATMAPAGITIDVETARDIEFNNKVYPWEEQVKIRQQTGAVLWSSRGLNPSDRNARPPIEGIANAESVAQVQELGLIMEKSIANIRTLIGVPLYLDGSDLPARMGVGVVQNQTAKSNNVTAYIPSAFRAFMEETLNKVCMLHWDAVVIKQRRKEYINSVLKVGVEMRATAYENQLIEQNIATWSKQPDGNGNFLLTPKDIFKIRQIKNFKLQDWYLSNVVEQNRKRAIEDSTRLQQQNAQVQQASLAQKAQADMQLAQATNQLLIQADTAAAKNKNQTELLKGFMDIVKGGVPIPPPLVPLMNAVFQNVGIPMAVENKEMQDQLRMQMQQQLMAQQQQAQAPQEGAPQEQMPQEQAPQEQVMQPQ